MTGFHWVVSPGLGEFVFGVFAGICVGIPLGRLLEWYYAESRRRWRITADNQRRMR